MNEKQELPIDHEVRLRLLEKLIEKLDERFESIDRKFDKIDDKFMHLDSKMNNQFLWTLGIMVTLFGGIILHSAKLI